MSVTHTDPGRIAVPFAELVSAAASWGHAEQLIDAGIRAVPPDAAAGCGPRVGPALAARLDSWRAELAAISQAVADHAEALRTSALTSEEADEIAARRFR